MVTALSLADGTATWEFSVPGIQSWFIAGSRVYALAGEDIFVASFADDADPATSSQAATSDTLDVAAPLSDDAFANGTFQLPLGCLETSEFTVHSDWSPVEDFDPTQKYTFVDGVVSHPEREYAQIAFETSTTLVAQGQPYTAAQFLCSSSANFAAQYIGIYSADGELLDSIDARYDPPIEGTTTDLYVSALSSSGSTLQYEVSGIGLIGDDSTRVAAKSGQATVTWGWDGETLTIVDLLYHLPTGDARTPTAESVQEVYDLVAEGKEASSDQVGEDLRSRLDDVALPFLESDGTLRKMTFPEGGRITECVLAGAADSTDMSGTAVVATDSEGYEFGYVDLTSNNITQGVFYCGVDTDGTDGPINVRIDPYEDSSGYYMGWLAVVSDASGTPTIVGAPWIATDFSLLG